MWRLVLFFLLSINLWSAETPYNCAPYQKDIDYWQKQYSILLKEKKEIESELSEIKTKELEKGIKIPANIYHEDEEEAISVPEYNFPDYPIRTDYFY